MSTQTHKNHEKTEEIEAPKKETKAEVAEHAFEAMKLERDTFALRVEKLEAFINEGLRTASWNSTAATELLKK